MKKILSCFYLSTLRLVKFLYDIKIIKKHAVSGIRVVSIGNLTFGGSGKTPMVSYLANFFDKIPLSYSVVSRGYKRNSKKNLIVSDKRGLLVDVGQAGDEPFMLGLKHKKTPIMVGSKVWGCRVAKNTFFSDVALVDDGFQSYYLKKDISILLIDSSVPFKDFSIFPLGKLRENIKAIGRANIVILTKINIPNSDQNKIRNLVLNNVGSQLYLESLFKSKLLKYGFSSDSFQEHNKLFINRPVVSFCGLANNNSFNCFVKKYCSNVKEFLSFSDHHKYNDGDIKKIFKSLSSNKTKTIITTFKDFVKLKSVFLDCDVFVIDVFHDILDREALEKFLFKKLVRS